MFYPVNYSYCVTILQIDTKNCCQFVVNSDLGCRKPLILLGFLVQRLHRGEIDCLKPFDGHYCLTIPTWKQNGGYKEPLLRIIHIHDEGIGGYLLALIREQQKAAHSYRSGISFFGAGSAASLG